MATKTKTVETVETTSADVNPASESTEKRGAPRFAAEAFIVWIHENSSAEDIDSYLIESQTARRRFREAMRAERDAQIEQEKRDKARADLMALLAEMTAEERADMLAALQ